jgi:hypothetical protein
LFTTLRYSVHLRCSVHNTTIHTTTLVSITLKYCVTQILYFRLNTLTPYQLAQYKDVSLFCPPLLISSRHTFLILFHVIFLLSFFPISLTVFSSSFTFFSLPFCPFLCLFPYNCLCQLKYLVLIFVVPSVTVYRRNFTLVFSIL